jgi:hypothetical protein
MGTWRVKERAIGGEGVRCAAVRGCMSCKR